jgi:phage terminase large subunit-like protein
MKKRRKDYHPFIDNYIDSIRSGAVLASKEIKQAMDYTEEKLDNPDVIIRADMISKAVELIERYFSMKLLDWELFVLALIHCYYKSQDMVVFDEFLIVIGTGNGKNGFISPVAWYLTTHYHGVRNYNVEIVANSEEQAKTSFNDIYEVLESNWAKLKRFFYKTKELILNLKTKSYIKFNTSNAKTRLGKRAGCLIFDEILAYEDWKVFNAFNASFGKKKHSRKFFITTNGYVRQGFLDDQLAIAKMVLDGEIKNLGFLPLIYKLDSKEEVQDKRNWIKANPSLPYFPELQRELDKAYTKMAFQPQLAIDFMTKRMNLPAQDNFIVVAPWEKILATNQPVPEDKLEGLQCLGGIDYARTTDFVSCGLLFKYKGKRYWLEHTFVCHKALEIESRPIKFPVHEMAERGLITIINRDNVSGKDVAGWFLRQAKKYHIKNIHCDDYRKSLLEAEFQKAGLPLESVRSGPVTHAKVAPLVEQIFAEETLVFGDNPTMRWYVNNTYIEVDGKGNTTYLKIEPKTRKTDGFFALIHALTKDAELQEPLENVMTLDVYTY